MESNPNQQPPASEEIWKILRTVSEEQREVSREMRKTEQLFKETRQSIKDTRESIKETRESIKETDLQMKETDRRIDKRMKKLEGLFTGQWGKLMESLVEGDLVALLKARQIDVRSTYNNIKGRRNGEHYEYDILAINSGVVVVVEVKTTMYARDVTHFLDKLAKFTEHEPVFRGKQIYGALAYLRVEQSADVHAERQGLFVIRATGSSASIINQADFQPREFR